ncbi:hypothetical protein CBOM_05848 [Ceraceosorus bombacis]|uniref:Uncharacterized protein n=1 Tax=Ceraceosorus bombacis TaxID=401625 RepID=A0A0P1BS83_9BASI|nr:hypothetical protein CBOM_05848 [Ceraceosorus bombacis]
MKIPPFLDTHHLVVSALALSLLCSPETTRAKDIFFKASLHKRKPPLPFDLNKLPESEEVLSSAIDNVKVFQPTPKSSAASPAHRVEIAPTTEAAVSTSSDHNHLVSAQLNALGDYRGFTSLPPAWLQRWPEYASQGGRIRSEATIVGGASGPPQFLLSAADPPSQPPPGMKLNPAPSPALQVRFSTSTADEHNRAVRKAVQHYKKTFMPHMRTFVVQHGFGRSREEPALHAVGSARDVDDNLIPAGGITSTGVHHSRAFIYMTPGQTYKHGTQMMEYEKPGEEAKLRSHAFVVDDLSKLQKPSFEDVDTSAFNRRPKIADEGKKHAPNAHSQTLGSNKKANKPKHLPSADQTPTFPGLARHVGDLPFTSYGLPRGRGGATASAEGRASVERRTREEAWTAWLKRHGLPHDSTFTPVSRPASTSASASETQPRAVNSNHEAAPPS